MSQKITDEFKLMSQKITDIIFNISINAQRKNDQDLKEEISTAIYILSKIFIILNKVVNNKDQKKVSDRDFEAQMVLWQSSNALIGSLQLIRQGYTLEPQIIMRNSIEYLAMALSFYGENSKSYYNKFKKQKLSGEECISEAKKLVKSIGVIYGLLSQVAHPSKKMLGYYMENRGAFGTLMIGGGVTNETQHIVKMNLAILNFILSIHWSSTELIFHNYLTDLVFWKKINNSQLKWRPDQEHEKIYKRSIQMFEEALAEADYKHE